jgi:ribosomal protein S18 acetylase RimI-like enzyme
MTAALVAVRRGDERDRAFVRDLGERSADASVSSLRSGDPVSVRIAFERLLAFVDEREHVVLIAERGQRRLGFLLLIFDLPDEVTLTDQAFIAYTAVEPDARGAGVGRALLDEAEQRARAAGRAFVSLMVTEDNTAALALYDGADYVTERRMMSKQL